MENIEEIRDKYFKECTNFKDVELSVTKSLKVILAPHDLFEWFKKEFKEENSHIDTGDGYACGKHNYKPNNITDEALSSISELIRSLSVISNRNPEAIREIDKERLATAKKILSANSTSDIKLKPSSTSLSELEKLKGGTHFSGTHNEFRTTFLGDWNDIERAFKNNATQSINIASLTDDELKEEVIRRAFKMSPDSEGYDD